MPSILHELKSALLFSDRASIIMLFVTFEVSNVMFEPSEMYASQTTCACYKWTSSRTLFSHSGVNSTEHGMFDHIGPVRHKTLFLPLVEKLV